MVERHSRASKLMPDGTGRLTPRQERVLELLAAGATNRQIARELSYSVSTVKADVSVVLRALGVANRTQAANVRGGLELARSGTSGTSAAP
jgi:DNA-binding NarL/FixJ family response regulator